MKRIFCVLLSLLLLASSLASCGGLGESEDKISIVTTVFPEYDWTRQILGEKRNDVELILLTKNGTDLHSYQPSVADMAKITTCDLLIYTGGTSDAWIDEALALHPSEKREVLKLTDLLSEDTLLFEQSEHHNNAEHHHDNEEYDEHVWLSLRLAVSFCDAICDRLSKLMPENEQVYRENCEAYTLQLKALDRAYTDAVEASSLDAVLFADRFPFSYLFHDYSLTCYAAFPGCSSETEASFKTISFLAESMDALSIPAVIVLENSDNTLAQTVINTTAAKTATIVKMNSMQAITREDIDSGIDYLSVMTQNLSALKIALGQ